MKQHLHAGHDPNLYFWRDHKGNEIDLIIENGEKLIPIEIKSGATKRGDYFTNLAYWNRISGNSPTSSFVIYGGDDDETRFQGNLLSWRSMIDYEFKST